METITDSTTADADQAAASGKIRLFLGQFNWRMMLVRVLINALTLLIIALLLPEIYFAEVERRILNVLFVGAMLGILNAFVKPIIQFLTLPFIFATYGLVVVAINTVMLLLLAALLDQRFVVENLGWAVVGGALMGLISSILESLFGLNLPIMPRSKGSDDRMEWRAPGPNPVERLLLGGVAGDEEADLATSDEVEPATTGDTEAVQTPTEPEPAVGSPPEAMDTAQEPMQPGDER